MTVLDQILAIEDKDLRMQKYVEVATTNPEIILFASTRDNFELDDYGFFIEALVPLIQVIGCQELGEELVAKCLDKRPMDYMLMPTRYRIKSATDAFLTATYNLVRMMRTVEGIDDDMRIEIQSLCEHASVIPRHTIDRKNARTLHALLPTRTSLIPHEYRDAEFWLESIGRFGETYVSLIDDDAWNDELMLMVGSLSPHLLELVPFDKRTPAFYMEMIKEHTIHGISIPEEMWASEDIFNMVLEDWDLIRLLPTSAITPDNALKLIEAFAPDLEVLQYIPEEAYTNQVFQAVVRKFHFGLRYTKVANVSLSIIEEMIKEEPIRIMQLPAKATVTVVMADAALNHDFGLISHIPQDLIKSMDMSEYPVPVSLWHYLPTEQITVTDEQLETIISETPLTLALVPWTTFTPEQKTVLSNHPSAMLLLSLAQR